MKKYLLIHVLFFLLIGKVISQNCASGKERVICVNSSFEKEVLKLTNKERKKKGLRPLKLNKMLTYSARYHAKDMAMDDYFEHSSYNRNKTGRLKEGCSTFERIGAFIIFPYMAENISAGQQTPQLVLKAWMKSKGHRKNILSKDYSEIGIGYYYSNDSEYRYYWVQNFGGE